MSRATRCCELSPGRVESSVESLVKDGRAQTRTRDEKAIAYLPKMVNASVANLFLTGAGGDPCDCM